MAQSTRGKEVTIEVSVEGLGRQTGSILQVKDWELKPNDEIKKKQYAGRKLPVGDYSHNGFDFSFSTDKDDAAAHTLHNELVSRENDDEGALRVTITVTERYRRTTGTTSTTYVLHEAVLMLESEGFGSADDFVTSKWSGYAERKTTI